jgi:Tol biopolymer transport system component
MRPATGGDEERLFEGATSGNFARSWSPDGRWLLYQRGTGALTNDLWLLSLSEDHQQKPFAATPFNETQAQISPDGRWVAYQSNEGGEDQIFVRPFPAGDGKWQISIDGGTRPKWSANGRELFFRSADRVMAAPVTSDAATFAAATPVLLFEGMYIASYDVARDGRFLMIKGGSASTQTELQLVLNWSEELKERVPTR